MERGFKRMEQIRLGRTGLMVSRSGFGAIPIQRISFDAAKDLLRKAYDRGINFYDTARSYTDSEEKIGYALADVRDKIIIATKSGATDRKTLREHLETSLRNLNTDYIDIYQLHNPKQLPDPDDEEGLYAELLEIKAEGKVRFIGITNHRIDLAIEAVRSGLYDTMQFPLNSLSSERDLSIIDECLKHDVGLIAMKGMSGGLITNAQSTFAFLRQYPNVVPIWGIQHHWELEEFLQLEANPPALDEAMWEIIQKDREELAGSFCRGCGYCLPCPADIEIPMAARMAFLLKRAAYQQYLTDEWKEKMARIEKCILCGHCRSKCPYDLDTPALLKKMLDDYRQFYETHHA